MDGTLHSEREIVRQPQKPRRPSTEVKPIDQIVTQRKANVLAAFTETMEGLEALVTPSAATRDGTSNEGRLKNVRPEQLSHDQRELLSRYLTQLRLKERDVERAPNTHPGLRIAENALTMVKQVENEVLQWTQHRPDSASPIIHNELTRIKSGFVLDRARSEHNIAFIQLERDPGNTEATEAIARLEALHPELAREGREERERIATREKLARVSAEVTQNMTERTQRLRATEATRAQEDILHQQEVLQKRITTLGEELDRLNASSGLRRLFTAGTRQQVGQRLQNAQRSLEQFFQAHPELRPAESPLPEPQAELPTDKRPASLRARLAEQQTRVENMAATQTVDPRELRYQQSVLRKIREELTGPVAKPAHSTDQKPASMNTEDDDRWNRITNQILRLEQAIAKAQPSWFQRTFNIDPVAEERKQLAAAQHRLERLRTEVERRNATRAA